MAVSESRITARCIAQTVSSQSSVVKCRAVVPSCRRNT